MHIYIYIYIYIYICILLYLHQATIPDWKKCTDKLLLLLFDNNKIKMARKPGKKQKENLVGCTGEGKR